MALCYKHGIIRAPLPGKLLVLFISVSFVPLDGVAQEKWTPWEVYTHVRYGQYALPRLTVEEAKDKCERLLADLDERSPEYQFYRCLDVRLSDSVDRPQGFFELQYRNRIKCREGYYFSNEENEQTCIAECSVGDDFNDATLACSPPASTPNSCTTSNNPIDFVLGRKFRKEEILHTADRFPIALSYYYNNQGNRLLTQYGARQLVSPHAATYIASETSPVPVDYTSSSNIAGYSYDDYSGSARRYWRHSYEDIMRRDYGGQLVWNRADGISVSFDRFNRSSQYPEVKIKKLNASEFGFEGYRLIQNNSQPTKIFDIEGRLRRVIDPSTGLFHKVVYSEDGMNINRIEHSQGNGVEFGYDVLNDEKYVSEVFESNNPERKAILNWNYSYSYDTGKLAVLPYFLIRKVVYPKSVQTSGTYSRRFEYADPRWPMSITKIYDSQGIDGEEALYAEFRYDDQGRAIYSALSDGVEAVSVDYPSDDTRTITNALGKRSTYEFGTINSVRRLLGITGEPTADCLQSDTRFVYDESGNIIQKEVNGILTQYEYNIYNLEVKRIEAYGTPEERVILTQWESSLRQPLEVEYPDHVVNYTYDANGHRLSRTVTPKH